MTKFYLISSIAALTFFSYAQHQGMSLTGARAGQQLASSVASGIARGGGGGLGRSSTMSHK